MGESASSGLSLLTRLELAFTSSMELAAIKVWAFYSWDCLATQSGPLSFRVGLHAFSLTFINSEEGGMGKRPESQSPGRKTAERERKDNVFPTGNFLE